MNGLFFQVELVVTETDAYALSDQQHIKKLKEEQKLKRLSSRRSSFIAESATDFDKKIETIVSHLNTQLWLAQNRHRLYLQSDKSDWLVFLIIIMHYYASCITFAGKRNSDQRSGTSQKGQRRTTAGRVQEVKSAVWGQSDWQTRWQQNTQKVNDRKQSGATWQDVNHLQRFTQLRITSLNVLYWLFVAIIAF